MGVRFIHTADLHLGSPLESVGAESNRLQDQLRDATYTAFKRIIDLAIEEDVDFLLVAGDLYDQKNRSVRANEFLADQFGRLHDENIPAYVIYGNHDPLRDATIYVDFPPNVHEFGHENPVEIIHPDESNPTARIWGQSYRTKAERRKMHTEFTPADGSLPNIGLLHTGLDPENRQYVPCSASELADIDHIHYWALGHIHHPTVYRDSPPILHPGVPQGRHTSEPGPGGCVLAEIETDGTTELEYLPTSPIVWHETKVHVDEDSADAFDLTTIDGLQQYIEAISEDLTPDYDELESQLGFPVRRPDWSPEGYICRWQLSGRGEVSEFLSTDEPILSRVGTRLRDSLSTAEPFVFTEGVVDRTGPPLPSIKDLRNNDRVVNEFFTLIDDLERDDEAYKTMREQLDYDKNENVWQRVEDPEAVDDDKLALTDERMDDLIDRAQDAVLNELIRQRAE